MAETFKQYLQRLNGYLGKRDPLQVQQATPRRLARLLRGVPQKKLRRRPARGKWSAAEIVAHLSDTEIAMAWRLRQMLGSPGVRLEAFDQDDWARALKSSRKDARTSLALFKTMRESNLTVLRSVPRRKWKSCYGMHAERGRETVAAVVRLYAGHDLNHLGQIERLLKR